MRQFLLIGLMFVSIAANSQNIRAGILAGFNATQVDGDNLAGYSKFGWNFGGLAIVPLSERFSVSLEILYSQKGSKSKPSRNNPTKSFLMKVDYADVPLLFNYHDRNLMFGAGVDIGTVVRYKEEIDGIENVFSTIPTKRRDYSLILNGIYFVNPHFGINVRWAYSIVPFAFSNISNKPNKGQYHNMITFRLVFVFGKEPE